MRRPGLQAHAEPRGSGPDYHMVAEALPAMVAFSSADWELVYANQLWTKYTGLSLSELGANRNRLVHPDDLENVIDVITDALNTRRPFEVEYRIRRRDGAYRWHLWRTNPVWDAHGELQGWLGTTTDIDDQKRLETALREGEARERLIGDVGHVLSASLNAPAMMRELVRVLSPRFADLAVVDLIGRDEIHRAATECPDESREIVAQLHVRNWRTGPGRDARMTDALYNGVTIFVPRIDDAWLAGVASDEQQLELARRLGVTSGMFVPLRAHGHTVGALTLAMLGDARTFADADVRLAEDIAARASVALDNADLYGELQRTVQDLRQANAAKDEFLGLVSHELKTPITTILGNAAILHRRGSDLPPDSQRTALADMVTDAERLSALVDNLLVVARSTAGRDLAVEREPLLLQHVVRRVVEQHQTRGGARRLTYTQEGTPAPVNFDEVHAEQVLRNLLENAEKYSPTRETVEVVVQFIDGTARVRVLDRGAGVDGDEASRLFEPFFRSTDAQRRAPGAGLGLAVCKRLIEAHGGEIWARRREGGGSEFGFALPLADADGR